MKFTSKTKFRAIVVLFLVLAVTVSCALWSVFRPRGNGEIPVSAVDSTEEIKAEVDAAANDFETITTVGLSAETVNLSELNVEAGKRIRFVVEGASDNPFNTKEGTLQITGEVTIAAQAEVIFDLPVELKSSESSKPVLNVYGTLTINDTFLNNGTVNALNAEASNEALESKGVVVNGSFNHDASQGGVLNVGAEVSEGDFTVSAGGALFIKGNGTASGLVVNGGTLTNNGSVIYDNGITDAPVSGGVVVSAQFVPVSSYSSCANPDTPNTVYVFYNASGKDTTGFTSDPDYDDPDPVAITLRNNVTWLSFGKTTFKKTANGSESGQNNAYILINGTANLGGGTINVDLGGGTSEKRTFTQGANELIFDGGAVWTEGTATNYELYFLDGEDVSQRTQYTNAGVYAQSYTVSGSYIWERETVNPHALVEVQSGATLNMYSGVKITNHETRAGNGIGGGIGVFGTLNMEGGEVSLCAVTEEGDETNSSGGGVYVSGTFKLNGGRVTRNALGTYPNVYCASGAGVAVSGNGSSLEIDGGEISFNHGTLGNMDANPTRLGADGGGVQGHTGAEIKLKNGTISNNWTGGYGGGVALWNSTFTMTGGTVIGNEAAWGGGICANGSYDNNKYGSYVSIQGGVVSENRAVEHTFRSQTNKTGGYGGGICVGTGTQFTGSYAEITGGTITENEALYGGGIAVYTTNSAGLTYVSMSGGLVTNNRAYNAGTEAGTFGDRASKRGDGIYFTSNSTQYTIRDSALLRLSGGAQVDSSNNVSFNFPYIENPSSSNFTVAPISVSGNLSCSGVAALVTINTENPDDIEKWNDVDLISGAGSQINKFLFDSTDYRFSTNDDALRIQLIESSSDVVSVYASDGSTLRGSYKTLEDAVAAAESGNIIEISQNLTITQPITVNKTLTIRPAGTSDISLFVASSFEYGGMTNPAVLQVTGSDVTLTLEGKNGCYFVLDGNKATSSGVALVTAINGASYIQNSEVRLRNNTNGAEAGALYIGSGSSATINGGEIVSNTSASGAIYVQSNATLNFNGGTISGNTGSGGRAYGIYLSSATSVLNLGGEKGTIALSDEIFTNGRINVLQNFKVAGKIVLDFEISALSSGYQFVYISKEYINGQDGTAVSSNLLNVFSPSANVGGGTYLINSQVSNTEEYPWSLVLDKTVTYTFRFDYQNGVGSGQLNDVSYVQGYIDQLNNAYRDTLREEFILVGQNAILITLHYGESIADLNMLTNYASRSGYSLMRWEYRITSETSALQYNGSLTHQDSTNTINLYSVWEANEYRVSFDGNQQYIDNSSNSLVSGSTPSEIYTIGETDDTETKLPQTGFVFVGYRFLGWYAKSGSGEADSDIFSAGTSFLDPDVNLAAYGTRSDTDKHIYTLTLYAAWESIFSGGGVGMSGNPFVISNVSDLETLEKTVNGEDVTFDTPYYNTLIDGQPKYAAENYEGYYFKLGGDIGSSADPFTGVIGRVSTAPVEGGSHADDDAQNHLDQEDQISNAVYGSGATSGGNGAAAGTPFKGTFDGDGNTVYLNINKQKTDKGDAGETVVDNTYGTYTNGDETLTGVGLFGYIDHATIRNLTLAGAVHGYAHVGGLVGYAFGGTIENVYNTAVITSGGHDVGGVIGTFYELSANYARSSVTNAANAGEVKYAPRENGNKTRILDVEENWNELDIIADAEGVRFGGVIGAGVTLRLTGGYNTGDVTARYGVGGVVGTLRSLDDSTANDAFITQSFNIGTVEATSGLYAKSTWNTGTEELSQTFITAYTGGVTGRLVGVSTVSNSFNGGEVKATFVAQITGVVSQNSGYTFVSSAPEVGSADSGDYLGARGVGGIVGFTSYIRGTSAGRIALSNVYNTGSVSAWAGVGGIAGYFAYANINEAFNGGNVTANGTHYSAQSGTRAAGGYKVGNDSDWVYVSYLGAVVGRGVSATLGATVSYNINSTYKGYTDATIQAIGDSAYNAEFGFTANTNSASGLTSAQMRVYEDHVLPSGFSQGFNTSGWEFLSTGTAEGESAESQYSYYPQLSAFTRNTLDWTFSVNVESAQNMTIPEISRHYARIMYTNDDGEDEPIVDNKPFTLTFVLGGGAFAFDGDDNSFEDGTKDYTQVEGNSDRYYYNFTYPQDGGATALEAPKAPVRVGYTFEGWYIDSTYTQEFDFGAIPGQNMVIYARWVPVSYRIDYLNVNDVGGRINGDYTNSFTVENATSGQISFPGVDNMFRRGYRFVEWQYGGEGNRQKVTHADVITSGVTAPTLRLYCYNPDNASSSVVADILFSDLNNQTLYLYAVWSEQTYDITYYLNDEAYESRTALDSVPEGFDEYTFGSQAFVLWSGETLNARNPGYIFNGWRIEQYDDTDEQNRGYYARSGLRSYLESGTVGDFVLVGDWTAVNYTLTFNLGIGSITSEMAADYGLTSNLGLYSLTLGYEQSLENGDTMWSEFAPNPPAGYTFAGWYTGVNGTGDRVTLGDGSFTMPAADTTLYAHYTLNEYTVTVQIPKTVGADVTVSIDPGFDPEDYGFAEGTHTEEDYVYTLQVSHGNGAEEALSAVAAALRFATSGWHFTDWTVAWTTQSEGTPSIYRVTGALTVTANCNAERIVVNFVNQITGATIVTETITAGSTVTDIPTFENPFGYTFRHWLYNGSVYTEETLKSVTFTASSTVYAVFAPAKVNATFYLGDAGTGTAEPEKYTFGAAFGSFPTVGELKGTLGYEVVNWYVQIKNKDSVSEYLVSTDTLLTEGYVTKAENGTYSVVLRADIELYEYTVTVNSGAGGSVSGYTGTYYQYEYADGVNAEVNFEFPVGYNASPNTGYELAGYLVNGEMVSWTEGDAATAIAAYLLENGITGNITITAQWQLKKYAVWFDAGADGYFVVDEAEGVTFYSDADTPATGGEARYAVIFVEHGTAPDFNIAPYRTGSSFSGWNYGGALNITSERSPANGNAITAYWTTESYSIRYELDGGSLTGNYATSYRYGDEIDFTAPAYVPTREGSTFLGWFDQAEGGEKIESTAGRAESLTLYAHWQVNTYALRLTISLPQGVEKATIEGWFRNAGISFLAEDIVSNSITVWVYAEYGTSLTALNSVLQTIGEGTGTAYIPVGWRNGDSAYYFSAMPASGNPLRTPIGLDELQNSGCMQLTNSYASQANYHTITVYLTEEDVTSGPVYTILYVLSGNNTVEPTDPARTGYTFSGWMQYNADGDDTEFTFGSPLNDNVVLYAAWTPNEYTVTFDGNGATSGTMDAQEFEYGKTKNLAANAYERTGYTFSGWATTPDGTVVYTDGTEVSNLTADENGKVTLYAVWEANTYTIVFHYGNTSATTGDLSNYGEKSEQLSFAYGATINYLGAAAIPHYSHAWYMWEDGQNAVLFSNSTMPDLSAERYEGYVETDGSTYTIHLYAVYTAETYYIRYQSGDLTSVDVTMETETKLKAAEPSLGYSFVGWELYTNGDSVSEGNYFNFFAVEGGAVVFRTQSGGGNTYPVALGALEAYTLVPHFEAIEYTIDFVGGEGVTGSTAPMELSYGATGTLTANGFAKSGYNFAGWALSNGGSVAYANGARITITSGLVGELSGNTITLYAVWSPIEYTITYVLNGGSLSGNPDLTYTIEESVTLALPAARTGYTFGGWYTSEDFSGDAVFQITAGSNGNKVFYAKWDPIEYKVTFNTNGGSMVDDQTVRYNEKATAPEQPTRTGYTFVGWYKDGIETPFDFNTPITGELTLTAKWKATTYTITYGNVENGEVTSADSYTVETGVVFAAVERAGYTLTWRLTNAAGAVVSSTDGMTGNITVWAVWMAKIVTVTLEADGADGDIENPSGAVYDGTISLPIPTRAGYTFAGWYTEGGTAWTAETPLTVENGVMNADGEPTLTLYAKWNVIEYTITYVLNGGSLNAGYKSSYTVADETFALETPVARTGYTFGGWYTSEEFGEDSKVAQIEKGSTGSKVFYAKWEPEEYTITYELNGGTNATGNPSEYTIESDTIVLGDPTKEGYDFLGWFDQEEGGNRVAVIAKGSTGNKILYARWQAKTYSVTLSGESAHVAIDKSTATYGNEVKITVTAANGYELSSVSYTMGGGEAQIVELNGAKDKFIIDISSVTGDIVVTATAAAKTFEVTGDGTGITITGLEYSATFGQDFSFTIAANEGYSLPATVTIKVGSEITYTLAVGENGQVTIPASYVTGDITVIANGVIREYTVTFDSNGGSAVENQTIEHNGIASEPKQPTRTGYTFDRWYNGETPFDFDTPITGDIKLTAHWNPIEYTVTFNANGGEGLLDSQAFTYDVAEGLTKNNGSIHRTGYTFLGWAASAQGGVAYSDGASVINLASTNGATVELFAVWQINTYTLTFELTLPTQATTDVVSDRMDQLVELSLDDIRKDVTLGGNAINGYTITVTITAAYNIPLTDFISLLNNSKFREFVVEGITYTLTITESGLPSNMPAESKKYSGSWTSDNVKTLNVYSDNGVLYATYYTTTNSVTSISLETPKKAGYTFNEWTASGGTFEGSTFTFADNEKTATLTAQWDPVTYEVTFNLNGATGVTAPEKFSFTYDELGSQNLSAPDGTYQGYTFGGWSYTGEVYTTLAELFKQTSLGDGNDAVKTEIELTAEWIPVTYTVEFNANGGMGAVDSQTITIDDADGISLNANSFVYVGYDFQGWATSEDGEVVYSDGANFTLNGNLIPEDGATITLYAVWKVKEYTLSFGGTDVSEPVQVKSYVESFRLPSADDGITRTGYTFLGWATEEGSNSAVYAGGATINANQLFTGLEGADDRTRTLYAVWQVNTYTVTLNGTNVTLSGDSTVEHNGSYELTLTAVTGYNLPETVSYTVNGGSETTADVVAGKVTIGNVTGNLVITAEGVAIGYTVTIDANGGSFGDGVQTKYEFAYGTNVYEALISTLTVTAPAYSHLSGWEVAWTQSVDGEPSMYALNGDITITAQYTATEGAVTVTIVHADGTVITLPATLGQVLRADDEIAPPDGYDYNDWYYYSNGEKVPFVFGETPVNGVITLYPNATAKKYDVAFTGTGVNAASDAVGEGKATFGQNYTVKLTVTEGYILSAENIVVTMDGTQSVRFEYNPATGMLTVYNVTGGITITATAEQLEYTVTFNYNDGSDSRTQKVAYGTAYSTLVTEQPAREGYRFRGWYLNGASVAEDGSVTGDITLVAQWERESYSVVFDNDGMKTEYTYLYGDTVTKPADPVKEGHTFLGWYWNDKEFNFETPVSDDLDLTARWQKNTYTVTFNANGGTDVAPQKVEYLGMAEMPAAPARDGYTFEGWYLNGTQWNFDEMPVTGDITLVAHWSENRYTVTFMDGDQLVASVTVAENGKVTAPALGTREGFTFEGWFNGETRFDFDAPITSNITLTAHWRAAEYTVRFETGSGTSVSDQVIAHGGKVAMPAVPEREGYIFAGWYLDGAAWNFDEMTVSGDMTLVARWTVKTYTVAFDPDGGSSVADQTVSHNGTATAPAVPSKSGYVFEGWFNGETQFDFATAITGDITLTAKWSPRKYIVSYVLGGGTNAAGNPSEYTVESDTITLGAPTREGYTFLGWYDAELNGERVTEIAAGSMGSITLYARWQAHTFEVSFVTNGGALDGADTQTVEAGGTVAYVEPTRENYLFVGWFTDEALTNRYDFNTAVSGELTLYAKWRLQVVTGVAADGTVVTVSSDAGFDDGTQLHFVEITDEDAVGSAAAHLQDNMTLARLFDIEIVDANGDPVAVTEPLSVGISVEGLAEAKGSWGVVYVPDGEGEIEVLATHVGADGRLYFFVEHFSFYAVVDIVEVAAGFAWWWILVAIAGCGLLALILVLVARSARRYELNYVNGGVPAQKLKESALIDLPLPEREEEAFDGWYYDEDFRDRATLTSMPKQNLILFAKWRKLTDEERAARDRARAEAAAMAEEGFHHAAPKQEKKHKENPLSEIQEDE